ncbi:hypothetical protein [Actinomyces qiguomingii]|uniref:hypothetical protein n=1 Tax=Actinomyces qiguomingii TaxID=2057800 RepID=UPI000FFF1EE4|nr:hypothetical protein [Actinomyces qiguomingii]
MLYDLIVRFDVLSAIASRLDGEQASLSTSPTDWSVPPQDATAGFPEAFNATLKELAITQNTLSQQIKTAADGVRKTSSAFATTEEEIAASARRLMRTRGMKP